MSLTESEKKFLTILGKNPSLPRSKLQHELKFKRASTVSRKMSDLRKAGYIKGPYYHINLNAVGKNCIYNTFAEIRFNPEQYNAVFQLLTCIDCWEWIFPTIQGDTLFAFFRTNYYMYLNRLLNMLEEAGLIEYRSHSSQNRWFVYNPDFFGSIHPQVTDLFKEVDLNLMYPKRTHDIQWKYIDLKMMQYLQVKTCSVSEIQRIEKRLHKRFWRRSQIKYSIEKIMNAGIAERTHYNISPFPRDTCYAFLLVVEGDSQDVLQFCVNFGAECRMYKAYTVCENTGFVWCWASPQLGPALMKRLDMLRPRIQARCLQLKSVGYSDTLRRSFNEELFNFEKQQWIFPYKRYEEEIEKILEKRKG